MKRFGQKQTRSKGLRWHLQRCQAFSSGSGEGSLGDFVQKAGLPVGVVSGSASPGPACVRARAGRPDRDHGRASPGSRNEASARVCVHSGHQVSLAPTCL